MVSFLETEPSARTIISLCSPSCQDSPENQRQKLWSHFQLEAHHRLKSAVVFDTDALLYRIPPIWVKKLGTKA